VLKDLGNTNFSIHLPRTSFDRHLTAQIVLRAVRALGVATAALNERNDICVGADKMSGAPSSCPAFLALRNMSLIHVFLSSSHTTFIQESKADNNMFVDTSQAQPTKS
jgi:hypothetical protein